MLSAWIFTLARLLALLLLETLFYFLFIAINSRNLAKGLGIRSLTSTEEKIAIDFFG